MENFWACIGSACDCPCRRTAFRRAGAACARFRRDEQELDPHLNAQSVQALREARHKDHNVIRFYVAYMSRAAHGDLGTSLSLGQPVRTLLRDRIPTTMRLLSAGLGLAWAFSLTLTLSVAWLRISTYDGITTAVSGTFLCIPAAVLALLSVLWNVSGALAIALIVFLTPAATRGIS